MRDWEIFWKSFAHLPDAASSPIIASVAILFSLAFVTVPMAGLMAYVSRKLHADLQARVGPNRAGFSGLLQPLADLIKSLQKVKTTGGTPTGKFWFYVQTWALYASLATLPVASVSVLLDTDLSALLPIGFIFAFSFATLMAGISQGSVIGIFSGIRTAAQSLSGAVPALLSLMTVGVQSGSFRWQTIVEQQGFFPTSWNIFSNPFQAVGFFLFVISGMIFLGVRPLDGGRESGELSGGVYSRHQGSNMSLLELGRFYGFFFWVVMASALYLGGWNLPSTIFEILRNEQSIRVIHCLELVVVLVKSFVILVSVEMIAAVTPRLRSDQVTDVAWKVLSPIAILLFMGTAIWSFFGATT